jgi:Effector Associated Constant Component 1
VSTEITITAVEDGYALEQFYHWLRADDNIARTATVSMRSASGSGQMGAFEVISMTISNTTALASLAIAYANWRQARKNAPNLTFHRGSLSSTPRLESPGDEMQIVRDLDPTASEEDPVGGDG